MPSLFGLNGNYKIWSKRYEEAIYIVTNYLIAITIYHKLFSSYFLNKQHLLSSDYSYFLPNLLSGYFWFKTNGIFSVPWFTPAFCGGVPYFANPQVMYYSIPQFLTFIFDPVFSVYLTFIIFASIGYISCYILLKWIFDCSHSASALGAALFLFNGFYLNRFYMGHLTAHAFMLIPLITYFLLSKSKNRVSTGVEIIITGLCLTYIIHSGAANYLIPILISVVGVWLIYSLKTKMDLIFFKKIIMAGVLSLCLSASKLISSLAFLSHYPRDFLALPGIDGIWNTCYFVFKAIFFTVTSSFNQHIVNTSFQLSVQGFQYGITFIPLVIILASTIFLLYQSIYKDKVPFENWTREKYILFIFLIFILSLPIILNVYVQGWNEILKSIPYIKNSSSLIRWIIIDIPLFILIASILINGIKNILLRRYLCILAIASVIIINYDLQKNRNIESHYSANAIINSYNEVKISSAPPEVKSIGVNINKQNQVVLNLGRNDSLINGISQLFCYEPIFGYGLENFPVKSLSPGSVFLENNFYLNLKNPSCYLYSHQNKCEPGDHFLVDQINMAKDFISYKPFLFNMSLLQIISNRISLITLLVVLLLLSLYVFKKLIVFIKK